MRPASRFVSHAVLFVALAISGWTMWNQHAQAWGLGGRSPVLSYDAAEYAVAARELAQNGRWGTIYALPIELANHAAPPWPMALVQPGLVLSEAALFRIAGGPGPIKGPHPRGAFRPDQLEWVVLVIPFVSFVVISIGLGLAVSHVLRRFHPGVRPWTRALAGLAVGLAFQLDPEAQHYAVGGFTELPFTLGLIGAVAALALGIGPKFPLLFGLELGVTGAFRGTMLWLAPVLALANFASAAPGRRWRALWRTMLGYALVLTPWWLYKLHAFGLHSWDLSALSVWDGVQGRSWFSLFHQPAEPMLPRGAEAVGLLLAKLAHNLPGVWLSLASGLRPLWIGALVLWCVAAKDAQRTLRVAGVAVLALALVSSIATAISVPQLRYQFPTRVPLEAAGLLALWGLLGRAEMLSPAARRLIAVLVALLMVVWGVRQTRLGDVEARETAIGRGMPSTLTLLQISSLLAREVEPGQPVMSNLGPVLAWQARRPVIHLAESPEAVTACRRRFDFRHVVLVFRDPARAWPQWIPVVTQPQEAPHHTEWNVLRARRYDSEDGFRIVLLDLGPLGPELAGRLSGAARSDD